MPKKTDMKFHPAMRPANQKPRHVKSTDYDDWDEWLAEHYGCRPACCSDMNDNWSYYQTMRPDKPKSSSPNDSHDERATNRDPRKARRLRQSDNERTAELKKQRRQRRQKERRRRKKLERAVASGRSNNEILLMKGRKVR